MAYLNETLHEESKAYTNATEASTGFPWSITFSNVYFALDVSTGVMAFLANGVVFTLLCFQRNSGKNVCNALIHNQTAIDFSASVFLIITYAAKIHGVPFTDSWGRFYCKLFDSNAMYALGINASSAGLMVISVERYTKIVHSVPYRVRFRPWMKYVLLVFPWIYSVLMSFPILMATSDISNGRCLPLYFWSADWLSEFYGYGTFIWKFLLPLSLFIFCYAKILLLIKTQSKIHTSNAANAGQCLLSRSEKNIVKTMLFVIGCYIFSFAPLFIYLLLSVLHEACCPLASYKYYIVVFISYLNIVINPFIYAAKSEIVKTLIRKNRKGTHHMEQTSTVAHSTIVT